MLRQFSGSVRMHMVVDRLLANTDALAPQNTGYLGRRPVFVFDHPVDPPPKEVGLAVITPKAMFPALALGLRMYPHIRAVLFRIPPYLTRNRGFGDSYFLSYTR